MLNVPGVDGAGHREAKSRPAAVPLKSRLLALISLLSLFAPATQAQATNPLSDAETQGLAFVQKILAQWPGENATNTGTLTIRDHAGQRRKIPVTCETRVTATNWLTHYLAGSGTDSNGLASLVVVHAGTDPNRYSVSGNSGAPDTTPAGNQTMVPFAQSDFWLCDLGLEFFHWPQQKVVTNVFYKNCACKVLESTNPHPAPNGYSRVVCWIDEESLGIVDAYAYDAQGAKLKEFYPKSFEKVNGQYTLKSMIMENLQQDSKTVLEFDSK